MSKQLKNYFILRVIVGALGEIHQAAWWSTAFLNQTSEMFLNPIFIKTHHFAQYQGVKEAACRMHDEFIGVGRVYHLFRLPEEIEYELQNLVLSQPDLMRESFENLNDSQNLTAQLTQFAGDKKAAADGPIRIGDIKDLSKPAAIENLAQHYLGAFSENRKAYPYFAD